ncbi:uncharacterized protein TNCT_455601 [Trichonephila clavata]|uniref:Uncharacterized protein n=1 Tax=Trichonephila clavata TaxID=2740835 RepID=A0A8X6GFE4_TRICU|nr:uncharacterized protein TNCT_20741 [Trichonephila clavata]GFR32566.1 uncharacterized protein TNCT_455601 [Trichonephila clavata]
MKRNITNYDTIPNGFNTFDKLFCAINGFKCPDYNCECSQYCTGNNYEKINIFEGDEVILFNEKLDSGTYCLPKGFSKCNLNTSIPFYSANDWICIPRNNNIFKGNNFIACKSPFAKDNSLNVLVDNKTGKIVTSFVKDFYEIYSGKFRYECQCGSKDVKNNPMINLEEVPFKCVSDYCISNFLNVSMNIGWDPIKKECNCQPFANENSEDLTTPCVQFKTGMSQNNTFNGIVKCTDKNSFTSYPMYCSNRENFFSFEKTITFEELPQNYLRNVI